MQSLLQFLPDRTRPMSCKPTEMGPCQISHLWMQSINQSVNQSINLYRAIVQRRVLQCGYAESKRNVLRRILNVLTDGAVRQFSEREFQSLGAATEKWQTMFSTQSICVHSQSVGGFQLLQEPKDDVNYITAKDYSYCSTYDTYEWGKQGIIQH